MGWKSMNWINLAEDRSKWRAVVNTVMNLWFSLNVGILLCSWAPFGFSRKARRSGGFTLLHLTPLLLCLFVCLSSPFVCVRALSVPRVVVDICSERELSSACGYFRHKSIVVLETRGLS